MNNTSFYRRPLPETAIEFGSDRGKQIFRQALAEGITATRLILFNIYFFQALWRAILGS